MSVILIKHHNESIYDATRKQKTVHKNEPRYVSKKRNKVAAEYAKVIRYSHRSMGVAEVPLSGPCNYLKKKTGIRYKAKIDPVEKQPSRMEPVLPTATLLQLDKERREKLPPEKNFICMNKRKVICLKPKVPEERMVIHCLGESRDMSRGMEPIYVFKKDFGKVPKYLSRFIREDEKKLLLQKDSEETSQPKCRYITKDQREDLLKGLKDNWEEMQKTYQGLPILTDTIPKMLRKAKLEADLKQLEKDIVLLERHPYIYVYEDNDLSGC